MQSVILEGRVRAVGSTNLYIDMHIVDSGSLHASESSQFDTVGME